MPDLWHGASGLSCLISTNLSIKGRDVHRIFAFVTAMFFLMSPGMPIFAETLQSVEVLPSPGYENGIADRDEFLAETTSIKLFIQGSQFSVKIETILANRTDHPATTNLRYQLPAGAKMTDFALDIQSQIPALYNGRLAGVMANNMFFAPNFEIPAHGHKTFQLSYSATYDPRSGISIPLDEISGATWMTIMVDARELLTPPHITLPNGQIVSLEKREHDWRTTFADAPYRTLMQSPEPILVSGGAFASENLHIVAE